MKRNIERINQLADRIEECEEVHLRHHGPDMGPSFTMNNISYACGSPACIMGHAQAMHCREVLASEFLGITMLEVDELCSPLHVHADYTAAAGDKGFITKQHAVAVLRNLAATGEVNWKIGAST